MYFSARRCDAASFDSGRATSCLHDFEPTDMDFGDFPGSRYGEIESLKLLEDV
jgi:hypothetical protein